MSAEVEYPSKEFNPDKICSDEEGGGSLSPSGDGGGGEISGGIWARERGNTAHIPGGQMMVKRRGLRFFLKLFGLVVVDFPDS